MDIRVGTSSSKRAKGISNTKKFEKTTMKICKNMVGSLLKHQQHAYPGPTYSFWKLKETFTLISFEELT